MKIITQKAAHDKNATKKCHETRNKTKTTKNVYFRNILFRWFHHIAAQTNFCVYLNSMEIWNCCAQNQTVFCFLIRHHIILWMAIADIATDAMIIKVIFFLEKWLWFLASEKKKRNTESENNGECRTKLDQYRIQNSVYLVESRNYSNFNNFSFASKRIFFDLIGRCFEGSFILFLFKFNISTNHIIYSQHIAANDRAFISNQVYTT